MKLEGKCAVVTGAGSGIGRAIAETFAVEGARVVAVGRTADKLRAVKEGAGEAGARILPFAADVASLEDVQKLFVFANEQMGRVDILVNNAGTNVPDRTLDKLTPEDFRQMVDVNLNGVFYCVHEALPQMRSRGDGLIITISSVAGVRASTLAGSGYSASKHGAVALSFSIGLEEGERGVRSCVICPGEVNTPILDKRAVVPSPERRAKMLQPEDLAQAALFVAMLPPRANVPELVISPTIQPFA